MLNEEFAQAIIFKARELQDQDENGAFVSERQGGNSQEMNNVYEQAAKLIMQDYFNND